MPLTGGSPSLHYEVAGDGGSPVLLVMGFGMHAGVWAPQVSALAPTHRVVTFDNRGIRHSQTARGPWRMEDLAGDAARVLDAAGLSSAHVVGVSMGGMVAQELALRAKERVRSLTLIVTHAGGPGRALPTAEGLRWFLRANLSPPSGRVHALKRLLYTEEFVRAHEGEALDARMQQVVGRRAHPTTLLSQLAAVARHDTRRRLRHIAAPTLVVQAAHDVLVRPSLSDVLHRGIRDARLLRVERGGHGVTFEAAAEVNRAILAHLAAVDATAP